MNEKESAIVDILRKDPFLTQQEMADELKMSRPALANLISGLTKRGVITGRAYVLSEGNGVVCIGGANVDRKFHLKDAPQLGTSNPVEMSVSVGGVARNIADNLGRLNHPVHLLTVAGNDADWQLIEKESGTYMDVTAVGLLPGKSTGAYSAVLNPEGELTIALANMDVYDSLSVEYIEKNERLIANAKLVVIDLNCPKETVEYVESCVRKHETELAIIPVSSPKMKRMPDSLEGVSWFICNEDEAETLTGISIIDEKDWEKAVGKLIEAGVKNVVVTRGSKGVMACRSGELAMHFPAISGVTVEDVTGAGDAFVSGVLSGHLSGMELAEAIRCGLVNAAKTLESPYTVRPELSNEQLKIEMEEF